MLKRGGKVSVKGLVKFFTNRGISIPNLDQDKWAEQLPPGPVYETFEYHPLHKTFVFANSNQSIRINWWKIESDEKYIYAELEITDIETILAEEGLDRDGKKAEIMKQLEDAGVDSTAARGVVGN